MIIDVHSHLYDDNSSSRFFCLAGEPDGPLPPERFATHALAQPVDMMILSANPEKLTTPEAIAAANGAVASLVGRHPRRLAGLCQVVPAFLEDSLREMDRHIKKGRLLGIGELCQYINKYDPADERLFPIIEKAIELDIPILYHASVEDHTRGLDKLASMFPKARFIMAHIGGMYNWPNGIEVARRRDNVWVDTSGFVMLCLGALGRAVKELGPSKMLFGVDFPLINAGPLVAALKELRLPRRDYELVAWRNAARLFGLDAGKPRRGA